MLAEGLRLSSHRLGFTYASPIAPMPRPQSAKADFVPFVAPGFNRGEQNPGPPRTSPIAPMPRPGVREGGLCAVVAAISIARNRRPPRMSATRTAAAATVREGGLRAFVAPGFNRGTNPRLTRNPSPPAAYSRASPRPLLRSRTFALSHSACPSAGEPGISARHGVDRSGILREIGCLACFLKISVPLSREQR
jgi:hypothetical protein